MIQRDNALWQPVATAAPRWEQGTLRSHDYGDIYFSMDNGPAESDYVFVQGNRLAERFAQIKPGDTFTIGELGFGTGLNFLLVFDAWCRVAPPGAKLHYIGIDSQPIDHSALQAILAAWPALRSAAERLLSVWPDALPGCHRRHLSQSAESAPDVILDLWWDTAADVLSDLASHGRRWVDAWLLDGFAPGLNPDMWSGDLWRAMSALSRNGTTVATFTAAGAVRRGLLAVGFEMAKRPGYGRKRESLVGTYTVTEEHSAPAPTPWDLVTPSRPSDVVVIGAGLAGAHVAHSLAQRGVRVTVLEEGEVAGGGSVNRQGVTYTRLSRRFGVLSDFALASYQYAISHYQQLFSSCDLRQGIDGQFCGYLQLSGDTDTLAHLQEVLGEHGHFAEVVDQARAETLTGVALASGGIWYPQAAWLHPQAICRTLLSHPNISVQTGLGELRLEADGRWGVIDHAGHQMSECAHVVLATAHATLTFKPAAWLPLQVIRGQTTHIASGPPLSSLRSVVCHKGYLPPAVEGVHCIGASFGPNDAAVDEREEDHDHNMTELRRAIPQLDADPTRVGGRVALRCNSTDYLPVSGPVTDAARFAETYPSLRTRGKARVTQSAPVHAGLWCLAGLGSRGLTAAPLAAEGLVAQMLGEPPPWPRYLQRAVSPARFLERRLKRGEL